jgi:hypothetical protein
MRLKFEIEKEAGREVAHTVAYRIRSSPCGRLGTLSGAWSHPYRLQPLSFKLPGPLSGDADPGIYAGQAKPQLKSGRIRTSKEITGDSNGWT